MLAHELRGPLAPLSNAMHLLHDRRTADSRRSEALQIMDRQLGHMARLVDDLLDASRIMHGTIPLRKSPVDLVGVLMHAVEDVRPKLTARDQEISLSLVQEPLWLNGDATRLHQVFCNLLDNASKYSAEESHIQLTAERVRAEIGDEVVVRVRDDGIGIDSAMLPRVFELFSQADNSASRSRGGLGIGLTVAKNLVTRHGGTIEARSDGLDKGSEFVVRLPLVPDPQDSEPRSTAPSAPATGSPERILVVDDNVDGAHSMSLLLRAAGHEVQAAFGSQDCFEAVASFRPQVIILDLGLPGVDGFEIARRLRGNPDTNDVVLIALSGYGGDEARQKTREIGFDYHLVKPADLDMLHQILASSARRADASSKKS
jgi:CheY-like chemotaxis protein